MNIQIAGKHMELGDALRERIASGLEAAVTKYFDRASSGHVTVSQDGHETEVDCNIHLPSGITLQATGRAGEPHAALDNALEKMEKRVRRYHRRLKDHHKPDRLPLPTEAAPAFVLQSSDDEATEPASNGSVQQPLVVAENLEHILTMSVAEAVMQLELGEAPAVLFRNAGHNGLNMVYMRADGHISWVDPGKPETKT